MWCKYFMEAQGDTIESNGLYQDRKLTILLAENGRISAGKNIRHIKTFSSSLARWLRIVVRSGTWVHNTLVLM